MNWISKVRLVIDDKKAFLFAHFLCTLNSYLMKDFRIGDHVHFCPSQSYMGTLALFDARLNYIGSAVPTRVRELTGLGISFIIFFTHRIGA